MIKLVIADGCSLTAGAELAAWEMNLEAAESASTSWSSLVQKQLWPTAEYKCYAKSGSSNAHIRRRVIYYTNQALKIYQPDEIVICVMWTGMGRKEWRRDKVIKTNFGYLNSAAESKYLFSLCHHTLSRDSHSKAITKFFKINQVYDIIYNFNHYFQSHETRLYDWCKEIYNVKNYCVAKKVKLIETYGFSEHFHYFNNFQPIHVNDPFVQDLLDNLNDFQDGFGYQIDKGRVGFNEFAQEHNFPSGPGGHPLEAAHEFWANEFVRWYRKRS